MSLLGCNQMLIQFYVFVCSSLLLLSFRFNSSATVCGWSRQRGELQAAEESTQITSKYSLSRLFSSTHVSSVFIFLRFSFPVVRPLTHSCFSASASHHKKLKKGNQRARQHMEVPHPAGVINKSAEEEGNGCNQLVKPTLGSARRGEGRTFLDVAGEHQWLCVFVSVWDKDRQTDRASGPCSIWVRAEQQKESEYDELEEKLHMVCGYI